MEWRWGDSHLSGGRPSDAAAPRGPEAMLLQEGHISPAQLRAAAIRQQRQAPQSSVLEVLVDSQVVSEALATQAVAAYFKLPSMQLDAPEIDPDTFALLPESYIRNKLVIPIRREGDEIVVGISYPADIFLIDDIKRLLKAPLRLIVVRSDDVRRIADELQIQPSQRMEKIVRSIAQDDVEIIHDEKPEVTDLEQLAGEGQVVQYVNYLVSSAVSEGASDIHVEPGEGHLSVRYRVDGILHEQSAPPLGCIRPSCPA